MSLDYQYLYEKIYYDIREKILDGKYAPGSILAKELDLVKMFKVSRDTIRKAMNRLSTEGYIYKVKGKGTFVKSLKADYKLSNMSSFTEIINNQNGHPNSVVIEAKPIMPEEKIQNELKLSVSEPCYYVERIRRNDKTNLCFEKTYINASLCPDIIDFVTPNASLYKLYESKYNLKLSEGRYNLEAISASQHIAKLLDIPENSAILYMEANISLINGQPLYFVEGYYIGSRYVFSTVLKR